MLNMLRLLVLSLIMVNISYAQTNAMQDINSNLDQIQANIQRLIRQQLNEKNLLANLNNQLIDLQSRQSYNQAQLSNYLVQLHHKFLQTNQEAQNYIIRESGYLSNSLAKHNMLSLVKYYQHSLGVINESIAQQQQSIASSQQQLVHTQAELAYQKHIKHQQLEKYANLMAN